MKKETKQLLGVIAAMVALVIGVIFFGIAIKLTFFGS